MIFLPYREQKSCPIIMNKIEILLNNQLLEVDLNDLKGNDDTLIAILNQDATNHKLFLEFAVLCY
jgi:hypothetical protein